IPVSTWMGPSRSSTPTSRSRWRPGRRAREGSRWSSSSCFRSTGSRGGERSGLVGALRYFLFRKVPRETNWFHTLGSATLTAFLVQAITGAILAFYYQPTPEGAYSSIRYITNDVTLGWLVRGMHKWGASVFIILLFLH